MQIVFAFFAFVCAIASLPCAFLGVAFHRPAEGVAAAGALILLAFYWGLLADRAKYMGVHIPLQDN